MAAPGRWIALPLAVLLLQASPALADDVSAQPGGVAIGHDNNNSPITIGLDEEKLVAVLERRGFVRTAENAGLERSTIIALARRLKPDDALDFDRAVKELERAVTVALEVIARGERAASPDAFVDTVLARVAEQIRGGDFDGGARTLDQKLAELQASHRKSVVALLEEAVKVDTLRRDALAVARRIETLVALDQPTDRPAWLPGYRAQLDKYDEDGDTKGINFSLAVAIELARRMAATAQDPAERGTAANLLGSALESLGEREGGTARLEQAVAAYRAALTEWTQERVPLEWATIQNNLGNALTRLGERESGTARLEQAVVAFRAALTESTQERAPLEWARTQNNLGAALSRLGERESGTARLEQAVAAYRAALTEGTQERVPLKWATTQTNLGAALQMLGERESGTARLEQAVAAFRAALTEWTEARGPLQWARTQNNLGNALTSLGAREGGTTRLEQAVTAFRAALTEWTQERVPLDWAGAQNNLGNALRVLGERERGTARLEQAVTAYRAALTEWTQERVPLRWAMTQNNFGTVLWTLGEREGKVARLEEALGAVRGAWDVHRTAGQEHLRAYFERRIHDLEAAIAKASGAKRRS